MPAFEEDFMCFEIIICPYSPRIDLFRILN